MDPREAFRREVIRQAEQSRPKLSDTTGAPDVGGLPSGWDAVMILLPLVLLGLPAAFFSAMIEDWWQVASCMGLVALALIVAYRVVMDWR